MNRQTLFRCIRILASALLALLICGASARAQSPLIDPLPGAPLPGAPLPGALPDSVPAGDAGADDPAWSRDVTPEQREQARVLFEEAAGHIKEYELDDAVAKYREALAVWDHPAIHANMGMALIALGRPLDAYRATQAALRSGPGPLGDDDDTRQRNAENLRKLAERARTQLAEVSVTSPEENIEVFIENERVTTGAGAGAVVLLPGPHRMSAQKTGHKTLLRSLALRPGGSEHLEITSVHRVTPWKPWVVLATGAGLTLAGTGLLWHAHGRLNSFEGTLDSDCEPPEGCDYTTGYDSKWASIRWEQRIGAGSLILGVGGALAGGALIWWNQQRRFHVREVAGGGVSITPVVSPAMTGVNGTMSF